MLSVSDLEGKIQDCIQAVERSRELSDDTKENVVRSLWQAVDDLYDVEE